MTNSNGSSSLWWMFRSQKEKLPNNWKCGANCRCHQTVLSQVRWLSGFGIVRNLFRSTLPQCHNQKLEAEKLRDLFFWHLLLFILLGFGFLVFLLIHREGLCLGNIGWPPPNRSKLPNYINWELAKSMTNDVEDRWSMQFHATTGHSNWLWPPLLSWHPGPVVRFDGFRLGDSSDSDSLQSGYKWLQGWTSLPLKGTRNRSNFRWCGVQLQRPFGCNLAFLV